MKQSGSVAIGLAVLVAPLAIESAHAHHSPSLFDTSATVTFDGTVTGFEWKNPHVFVHVDRIEPTGEVRSMQVEADGVSMLLPHGWSPDALQPGDQVRVEGYPARNPARNTLLGYSITKADGTVLPPNPDRFSPASEAASSETEMRATSIEGVWLPRWEAFFGLTRTEWPFNAAGERYRQLPESERIPLYDCVPYAAPRIMVIPVRSELTLLPDRVLIHVDWLDVERVVYTDGRGHPEEGVPTIQGHSIGRWEGDALLIDTTLFSEESIGDYALATGPEKHLTERLALSDDGRTLRYDFTLEDPAYLLEPVSGGGVWEFRPELEPSLVECDIEAARRDLEEAEP